MLRFRPPTSRGRYGEESKEGQDREEGQEGKSQKEEVVSLARADSLRPGNFDLKLKRRAFGPPLLCLCGSRFIASVDAGHAIGARTANARLS
jgi:hypothetical protein